MLRLTVAAYLSLNVHVQVVEETDSSKMRSRGNITRLPQEPLALICSHLGPGDICRLQETCGFLFSALREPKAPVYCCSSLLRLSALLLHVVRATGCTGAIPRLCLHIHALRSA